MSTLHLTRFTDPVTSHLAVEQIAKSGALAAQRQVCLRAVHDEPGLTAAEILAKVECERHVPSRRLPDLRKAGLVVSNRPRICRVTGSTSLTWWPIGRRD